MVLIIHDIKNLFLVTYSTRFTMILISSLIVSCYIIHDIIFDKLGREREGEKLFVMLMHEARKEKARPERR